MHIRPLSIIILEASSAGMETQLYRIHTKDINEEGKRTRDKKKREIGQKERGRQKY